MAEDRLLCPTSGLECAYREFVAGLYEPVDQELLLTDMPSGFNPTTDGIKCGARLFEHSLVARALQCSGPAEDGACPTAESMSNNRPRSASKTVVRKVISLFRGTK